MTIPPVNPYAPSGAVAADSAAEPKPPRKAAVVASLVSGGVFAGCGLLLLGRPKRFVKWLAAGVGSTTILLVAILVPAPRVAFVALALYLAVAIAAIVDTARVRPLPAKAPVSPWLLVVIAFALSFTTGKLMRGFVVETFQMPSGSMLPTLLIGDHFLVDKRHGSVGRGDVVVLKYPPNPEIDYVKRVIAVGGDHVEMREGVLYVNGKELPQRELGQPCPEVDYPDACSFREESDGGRTYQIVRAVGLKPFAPPTDVPPGHLYVVGDDRDNSNDSRAWGTVPLANVKGRALFVGWSRKPDGDTRWDRLGKIVR
jgi:signal peptidase I